MSRRRDAVFAPFTAYTPGTHALTPECRAKLREIDLHLHDLRHEGASRLVEQGWPLHYIRDMLGHANLSQTSTYLNAAGHSLQAAMRELDERRETSAEPSRCKRTRIRAFVSLQR